MYTVDDTGIGPLSGTPDVFDGGKHNSQYLSMHMYLDHTRDAIQCN
jgi:hypothetical protein